MSVGYNFLDDMREAGSVAGSPVGELRKASVQMAGVLGDVELLRAEGVWMRTWPASILSLPGIREGTFSVSTTLGFTVPLGWKRVTPWEDRFFLGGASGGIAERFPGFAGNGIGPIDVRRDPNAEISVPAERRPELKKGKSWRFDRKYREQSQYAQKDAEKAVEVDHIGGNARTTANATLQVPLPLQPIGGVQLHGVMTGAVGSLVDSVRPSMFRDFATQARASVALGVGAPLPCGGFVGLTFAQPLLFESGDVQRKLQLSFSSSFGL